MRVTRVHVAIVNAEAAARLLQGIKRIETRFLRDRRTPYDRIASGEAIHFKLSGGDIIGTCAAARVLQFDNLTPARVAGLRRRFNHIVCAPPAYWRSHRQCRYGVLIWLQELRRPARPLRIPRQYGTGWLTLPVR